MSKSGWRNWRNSDRVKGMGDGRAVVAHRISHLGPTGGAHQIEQAVAVRGQRLGGAAKLAVLLLYACVVWPIAYYINDVQLTIRAGLWRTKVPLADIVWISPSRNPLTSPALSLDRLRIDRRNGRYYLISPADRTGFIHTL